MTRQQLLGTINQAHHDGRISTTSALRLLADACDSTRNPDDIERALNHKREAKAQLDQNIDAVVAALRVLVGHT